MGLTLINMRRFAHISLTNVGWCDLPQGTFTQTKTLDNVHPILSWRLTRLTIHTQHYSTWQRVLWLLATTTTNTRQFNIANIVKTNSSSWIIIVIWRVGEIIDVCGLLIPPNCSKNKKKKKIITLMLTCGLFCDIVWGIIRELLFTQQYFTLENLDERHSCTTFLNIVWRSSKLSK